MDDTLFKRRGEKVFGAARQHDGAAVGRKPVGRGTCFVVVGLVVELPMLSRPVCLPGPQPSAGDMLAKLRRVIIASRFLPIDTAQPTDREIRAVQQAWASAGLDTAA